MEQSAVWVVHGSKKGKKGRGNGQQSFMQPSMPRCSTERSREYAVWDGGTGVLIARGRSRLFSDVLNLTNVSYAQKWKAKAQKRDLVL